MVKTFYCIGCGRFFESVDDGEWIMVQTPSGGTWQSKLCQWCKDRAEDFRRRLVAVGKLPA